MLKIKFTEAEVEQLYQQFMEHPSGLVKKKLHVIYLKSLGLPHYEIARIARISGDRVTAYLTIMKMLSSPRKMKDTVREAVERGRSNF